MKVIAEATRFALPFEVVEPLKEARKTRVLSESVRVNNTHMVQV
jgi:hypothetical protein